MAGNQRCQSSLCGKISQEKNCKKHEQTNTFFNIQWKKIFYFNKCQIKVQKLNQQNPNNSIKGINTEMYKCMCRHTNTHKYHGSQKYIVKNVILLLKKKIKIALALLMILIPNQIKPLLRILKFIKLKKYCFLIK